ncbi:MAG: hypothetical protein ACE5R6_01685 [Candidatus Heimdallarchaeota archaeon]
MLDQFLKNVEKKREILWPELAIPAFFLGQLLQQLQLDENDPFWKVKNKITNYLAEFDLKGARKELLTIELPSKRTDLITSILLVIKTIIGKM